MPLQHRHEYAAVLPRGLLAGNRKPASESQPPTACAADRPIIHQVGAGGVLEGL
jgi:hypothetical protein